MVKKKAQEPSATTLKAVSGLITNVSAASVKSWLKGQDLASTAVTRDQLERRIAGLIDTGELKLDVFREAVIGIEESGGKIVHLFEIDGDISIKAIEAALKNANITVGAKRDFASANSKTTLVYTTINGDELRMKWSENHQKPEMDLDTLKVRLLPVKKVVVLRVRAGSKKAEIQYDSPEVRHPHSTGHSAPGSYYEYYRNFGEKLLGIKLVPSELRGVLKQLIEEAPPVVEVTIEDHTNEQGNRVRVTARRDDVRKDKDFQAMHSQNSKGWAYDSHSFYWLPAPSGGRLKRRLFSALDADEKLIRVRADCNEEELNYAIEQVRARQGKASKASQAN